MAEQVTVLDLMGQASASTPGPEPPPPPRGGEDLMERVERLTGELEQMPDPGARAVAEELVAAVLEFHGDGAGADALDLMDEDHGARLADEDEVVASLLLIHDLYPVALEERVVEALDSVRPYMESHGGDVELLGVEDGVARLRLEGSCQRLRGVVGHAGAGDQEGADGDRARPAGRGGGGRSTSRPPTARRTSAARRCRWPARRGATGAVPALAGWQDLDAVAAWPDGQMTAHGRRAPASCWWPT